MAWTSGALLVVLAQLVGAAGGPPADSSWPEERLSTLAFGSCSKPLYPQPLWDAINAARPQVWLWAGDAVYLGRDQPEGLREAYQAQLAHPGYRSLLNTVKHVDGVYDDHDLGENDAGKHFAHQKQSQAAFLDFLGVGTDAPSPRRERHGVYSSHVFGAPPHQTKVQSGDMFSLKENGSLFVHRSWTKA
ncbi:hypothetical protein T484DRAFT_1632136 [Baffinella frigidus]|nr:hypothetical protein T484DRAFT_1632136 [Cryptophyta sp. CCMP2293]